jgi:hypothetical protein
MWISSSFMFRMWNIQLFKCITHLWVLRIGIEYIINIRENLSWTNRLGPKGNYVGFSTYCYSFVFRLTLSAWDERYRGGWTRDTTIYLQDTDRSRSTWIWQKEQEFHHDITFVLSVIWRFNTFESNEVQLPKYNFVQIIRGMRYWKTSLN